MIISRRTMLATAAAASLVPRATMAQSAPPNIVVILTDDQTYESYQNWMPLLNARTDLVRFTQAFDFVSLCAPSRATILSGQYDTHHHVINNQKGGLFDETKTIATLLHDSGYRTHLVGKYINHYPFNRGNYVPPGWDDWHAFFGNPHYNNYDLVENGVKVYYPGSDPNNYENRIFFGKALDIINTSTSQPFFLYLAPYGPHYPQTPDPVDAGTITRKQATHAPDFNAVAQNAPSWQQALPLMAVGTMDTEQSHIRQTVQSIDRGIADVFAALAAKGILENTYVFFMTDNGFTNGEHRWDWKMTEYDADLRIPLAVRVPGGAARTVDALAQNTDIYSTLADLAGATPTLAQDGISLAPWLRGQTPASWRTALLHRWSGNNDSGSTGGKKVVPAFWAVRTDQGELYVELAGGETEFYDLNTDPYELDNIAVDPDTADRVAELASLLATMKAAAGG